MVRAAVSLCGIELDNPVIPASGTFGYGYTFAELYDIDCLGTFPLKEQHASSALETRSRALQRRPAVCSTPWACKTRAWTR